MVDKRCDGFIRPRGQLFGIAAVLGGEERPVEVGEFRVSSIVSRPRFAPPPSLCRARPAAFDVALGQAGKNDRRSIARAPLPSCETAAALLRQTHEVRAPIVRRPAATDNASSRRAARRDRLRCRSSPSCDVTARPASFRPRRDRAAPSGRNRGSVTSKCSRRRPRTSRSINVVLASSRSQSRSSSLWSPGNSADLGFGVDRD